MNFLLILTNTITFNKYNKLMSYFSVCKYVCFTLPSASILTEIKINDVRLIILYFSSKFLERIINNPKRIYFD